MNFDILADGRTILQASSQDLQDWMKEAFQTRVQTFGTNLFCYSPTAYPYNIADHVPVGPYNFLSLSVTGTSCSLKCEHCDGRLLKGMESTPTPESLFEKCKEIKSRGGEGVLISGGSDSFGHVPLERFGESIARIKNELDMIVVVHTGLVDTKTAHLLAEARIDAAMLDVIGDETVASKVYHIEDGPKKMRESLDILEEQKIPTVPHILVGLDYGHLRGEIEALELISFGTPSALVIIALSPIRKTPMEDVLPPPPEDIGRIMTAARFGFRNIPVLLGCARPLGQHKISTDAYAIQSGMNGIALISQEGVNLAKEFGLSPIFKDICCSLAYLAI
ncbi:MAG: radical SAM protein [Candidatus Thorarchaeota archaeon]|nr:radical SAM protein [Candidatus Thorarchaeota archaeon]